MANAVARANLVPDWTRGTDGAYITEASDLIPANWDGWFTCPKCGKPTAPHLVTMYDADGDEVIGWSASCHLCLAMFWIVND